MRLLLKGLFATILLLVLVVGLYFYIDAKAPLPSHITYGLTYSPRYATFLGLDWRQGYLEVLRDLRPTEIRLMAYWDEVAPTPTNYHFDDLDFMLNEAGKNNIKVILAVGQKLPRWPECYQPAWVKDDFKISLFSYLATVVGRYKANPTLKYWQVENEPYFGFGKCPIDPQKTIDEEVALVKKLDSLHPIIVTDSGEWGAFNHVNDLADFLGISLYRRAQNDILGDVTFPLPANYYKIKTDLLGWNKNRVILTELQMEPWFKDGVDKTSISDQLKLFNAQTFRDNLAFANRSGFNNILLWGTEWWLYLKEQGHPEVWEAARGAFNLES